MTPAVMARLLIKWVHEYTSEIESQQGPGSVGDLSERKLMEDFATYLTEEAETVEE